MTRENTAKTASYFEQITYEICHQSNAMPPKNKPQKIPKARL